MPFRVAVHTLVSGQVRAGMADAASTAFQGGRLFMSPREACGQALHGLDYIQRIEPNSLRGAWNRDARDANLGARKDPSGNP